MDIVTFAFLLFFVMLLGGLAFALPDRPFKFKPKQIFSVFLILVLLPVIPLYSNAQVQTQITETLNSSVCSKLIIGQNASENFVVSTCIISASTKQSPFFLTNFTTTLIIPSGSGLTLNSGFGFANYGQLNNSGIITQKVPLINYGQILNYGSWSIQSTFVQMNDTGASVLTSGFLTNQASGTITVTSTGFLYNGNRVINNGVITNNGHVCKSISGYNINGTFVGNVIGGNSITC